VPPPFNIDNTSPSPTDVISAFPTNEQQNRSLIQEWLAFISDPDTGELRTEVFPEEVVIFPSGTRMLFQQTAAPTGWTKDTTHNNKALRLVSGTVGTGGTVAFTTAFANQDVTGTISGTALTIANLPAHTHSSGTLAGTALSAGNHAHTVGFDGQNDNGPRAIGGGDNVNDSQATSTAGAHTHVVDINSGSTGSTGSGTAHGHTFTGTDINLAVQYVDFIIAEKD